MKKINYLLIVTFFVLSGVLLTANTSLAVNQIDNNVLDDTEQLTHVPGEVIIKFKPSFDAAEVAEEIYTSGKTFAEFSNDTTLDNLNKKYKTKHIKRVIHEKGKKNAAILLNKSNVKKYRRKQKFERALQYSELRKKYYKRLRSDIPPADVINNDLSDVYKIEFTDKDVDLSAIISEYSQDPNIEYVSYNSIYHTSYMPNDEKYDQQWAHEITGAEKAWDIQSGSPEVVIAIIDTGVDYMHEDLNANIWFDPNGNPGQDFVNINTASYGPTYLPLISEDYTVIDNDPKDYNGHGTHCSGIAAAMADNNVGVSGVCPNCKIMPVRAGFSLLDTRYNREVGLLTSDAILNGINYAIDNGADVVSMSFGGGSYSSADQSAINRGASLGVVFVAAAGNSNSSSLGYPANYANVISVAAVSKDKTRAYYSNYGTDVDIAAPGGDLYKDNMMLSTVPKVGSISDPSGYKAIQGTSMATPYAAGMVGLLKSQFPNLSVDELKSRIFYTAEDLYGISTGLGYGLINIDKALTAEQQPVINISKIKYSNNWISYSTASTMTITLKNFWQNATNVQATLSSDDPNIIITNNLVFYGDLLVNATKEGDFTFQISSNAKPSTFIDLQLEIISDQNVKTIPIKIKINFPLQNEFMGSKTSEIGIGTAVIVEDIDNDNQKELIYSDINKIYVRNPDGTDKTGWPVTNQLYIGSQKYVSRLDPEVSVGDVNNDGKKEIVAISLQAPLRQAINGMVYKNSLINSLQPMFNVSTLWTDLINNGYIKEVIDMKGNILGEVLNKFIDLKGNYNLFMLPAKYSPQNKMNIYNYINDMRNALKEYSSYTESKYALEIFGVSGNRLINYQINQIKLSYLSSASRITLDDIDKDGNLEIIFGINNKVYVLKSNGSIYSSNWPVDVNGYLLRKRISAADINSDGYDELIVTSSASSNDPLYTKNQITAFTLDGNILYQNELLGGVSYGTVVVDVDNDFKYEIFLTARDQDGNGILIGYKNDFSELFPHIIFGKDSPVYDIAVGDIDGDKDLEIVFSDYYAHNIFAYHHNGKILDNWPVTQAAHMASSVILADIDDDKMQEIIAGGFTRNLSAYNYDGTLVEGFPIDLSEHVVSMTNSPLDTNPFVGDLNSDGFVDLAIPIVNGIYSSIYVFNLPSKYVEKNIHWPTVGSNANRTGVYKNKNHLPKIMVSSNYSVKEGEDLEFNVTGFDQDDDNLTMTARLDNGNSLSTINASFADNLNGTGVFVFKPDYSQSGQYVVIFEISDGESSEMASTLIDVENVPLPPKFVTIPTAAITVEEGAQSAFYIKAEDLDSPMLNYSAKLSDGRLLSSVGAEFKEMLLGDLDGNGIITSADMLMLRTKIGVKSAEKDFYDINRDGVVNVADISAIRYKISYGVTEKVWAFKWTPTYKQAGNYNVVFTVSDEQLSISKTVSLKVNNIVVPPPTIVIAADKTTVKVNEPITIIVAANSYVGLAAAWWYVKDLLIPTSTNIPGTVNAVTKNLAMAQDFGSCSGKKVCTYSKTITISNPGSYQIGGNSRDILYPIPGEPHQASEGAGLAKIVITVEP